MAAKKVGVLIREARQAAGMTQEQLARRVRNCSASDISAAERGTKVLTNEQLKQIAKATGVTQSSLLNAPSGGVSSSSAKKPASSGKKPAASSTAAKSTMRLTATEKRLVELYRSADKDTKSAAMKLLKGEDSTVGNLAISFLEGAVEALAGKKTASRGLSEPDGGSAAGEE